MITPAGSAPVAPAQMGVRDSSWYRETAPQDTRTHADEVMASHGCVPSPEAAVSNGVTPPPGGLT